MNSTHNVNHCLGDDYDHTQNGVKRNYRVSFFFPFPFFLHSFFVRPSFAPFSLSVLLHISLYYLLLLWLLCPGSMKTKIKTHIYILLVTESEKETALNWTI